MVIDCHYHLETRMQSMDNLLSKMASAKIDKVALMATMLDVPPTIPAFLLKLLRFTLFNRLLRPLGRIFATEFSSQGDVVMLGKAVKLYPDPDNEEVAAAIAKYPDKFFGWIFVNPQGRQDPLTEFERWKNTAGFIGVKAHPHWHRFEPKALINVAQRAASAGMPMIIHAGFGGHGDFAPLARAVPDLKLILAHAGFPRYTDTWKEIRNTTNIYVDLSCEAYVEASILRRAVAYLGEDRCLFGTDGPYGTAGEDGLFDNGLFKRRIESLFTNERTRRKLLGENFRNLIGY